MFFYTVNWTLTLMLHFMHFRLHLTTRVSLADAVAKLNIVLWGFTECSDERES